MSQSPQLQRLMPVLRAMKDLALRSDDVQVLRNMMESTAVAPPRATTIIETSLDGVRGEWLLPDGCDHDHRILYLHGGGYVAGSPRTHRTLAANVGRAASCAVFSVDYRLAPEHPFPAALQDASVALDAIALHGPERRTNATTVFVVGDSAGGGLALATMVHAAERGADLPAAAAVMSPWTDLAATGASIHALASVDPIVAPELGARWAAMYANGADRRAPGMSPLYADLRSLPPTLIQVGEHEILLDDSIAFAERARSKGVHVELERWPQMFHGWQSFAPVLRQGREAIDRMGMFLRSHCRPTSSVSVQPTSAPGR